MTKIIPIIIGVLIFNPLFSQSNGNEMPDNEKLNLAKYALKNHNCQAAIKTLLSMSASYQNDPQCIYYLGNSYLCEGDTSNALVYYRKYNELIPNQKGIMDTIAMLDYKSVWGKSDAAQLRKSQLPKEVSDKKNFIMRQLQNYICYETYTILEYSEEEETTYKYSCSIQYSNVKWDNSNFNYSTKYIEKNQADHKLGNQEWSTEENKDPKYADKHLNLRNVSDIEILNCNDADNSKKDCNYYLLRFNFENGNHLSFEINDQQSCQDLLDAFNFLLQNINYL